MMGYANSRVYIVSGRRTPFGKFGGMLGGVSPVDLAMVASKALMEESVPDINSIDQVLFANVIPSTPDTLYAGRHLGLRLGLPIETPGIVLNRLCGSGIQALIDGARLIRCGEAQVLLIAGAENLTMAPHLTYGARFGTKYGPLKSQDLLLDTLYDKFVQLPMGITAENLADDFRISKEDSDKFSYESHRRANEAYQLGLIQPELAKVKLTDKNFCEKDEHLREEVSFSDMQKLKPTFKKEGIVTAGSASGIVDGACAMIIASEEYIIKYKLQPLAEIIDGEVVGVDPSKMGIGPVPAINNLLKRQGLSVKEIDLIEINEAFAPQVIACQKSLGIEEKKLNIWGGAIALGHPLGATGLKITLTLARQLKHYDKTWGISSACIGGGQGIALLIKKV